MSPDFKPTEVRTRSMSASSPAARPTGTWLAQVRLAAWARTPRGVLHPAGHPAGTCPMVVVPPAGQVRAWTT